MLTALISYGTGSLARRLAGCLAFAASTFFHCILKVFRIQCFNVLHHSSSFPLLLAVQCALAKPSALLAHGLRPISSFRILAVTMLRMLPSPVLWLRTTPQCALAKPLALLAHGLRPIRSSRILAVTMLRMLPSPVL